VGCRLPVVCRGGRRIGCSAAASQQGGDGFKPYISLSSGPWTHLRIRASNDATDHALPAATCAASSPPPALTRVSKTETGSYARRRRALLCFFVVVLGWPHGSLSLCLSACPVHGIIASRAVQLIGHHESGKARLPVQSCRLINEVSGAV
jgi:hypothetical protein